MAGINQALTVSYKSEVLIALHNFNSAGGNTFKIALIKPAPAGTYDVNSTNYSNITGNSDEASGTGYSAGGNTLTNSGVSTGGSTAFTSFSNTTWAASTITSIGAMIYNSTNANRAVAVLSFGGTISSTGGNFTVTFPSNDQNNAIIRWN